VRVLIFGGFLPYQIQLANALSTKNQVMLMIPANAVPCELKKMVSQRVTVCLLGRNKSIHHPMSLLSLKDAIVETVTFDPDVIHMQIGGNLVDLMVHYFFRRYPFVTTFHDVRPHMGEGSRWVLFSLRRIAASSDEVIVHGHSLRNAFIELYDFPPSAVHVVPMGSHYSLAFKTFEDPNLLPSRNIVLFFGRIHEYKGLQYLIEAEPLITKEIPDARIVIAGTGEDFSKYEKMIGCRRDRFIIANRRIANDEAARLFQQCSVVVLPYVEASQSGVVLDAYEFKKPVVVTNVGSLPEVVDHGTTGLLVPPRDSEALADAVIRILANSEMKKRMGENGYAKLRNELSWDAISKKTIEVYQHAIQDHD
jgi:glycosyltransferase involved in cell wall biosynthesis